MSHLLDLTLLKVGIGACLFIGGNLTAYAILQRRYRSQRRTSQNLEVAALIKQIKDLRKEINELNRSVNDELKELSKEIQQLNSDRRSRALSVWSYKTACSEEEGQELGQVSPVGEIGLTEVKKSISFEEKKRLFYGKVDELYAGGDEDKETAMRMLQDNEFHYKDDWEFLWRLGRSHISLHEMRGLVVEKKTHAIASLQYTEEALKLYEPSADVHKWYAIALGTMTDYISTKEKITNGFKLKEHILRALELSPSDATLHFMMGRWCYGVYMLSWVERKLAATLFATPPESTIEDALKYFLKAEEINSGFYKANQLYIAKCHYEMSEYDEAKRWLVSAKQLDVSNSDDGKTHEEATTLLEKL